MKDTIIQIYGIRTPEDARVVIENGGHHLGVSYGKIKRTPGQLTCEQAKVIFDSVKDGEAVKIGLTIAEDIDEITENLKEVLPDVLHLSGEIEGITPAQVKELKSRFPTLKIMQAIPVYPNVPKEEQKAFQYIKEYEEVSDFYLIDTKVEGCDEGGIGATGLTHDIMIDKAIVESTPVPCIIAGGLTPDNVAEAVRITQPYGADSYSWTNYDNPEPGKPCKDPAKIKAFCEAVRNA